MAHQVTLTLRSTGTVLNNWDRYDIVSDMEKVGNPWTFSLWHSENNDSAWQWMLHQIRLGDQVTCAIDGAPQLTGRIEDRIIVRNRHQGCCMVISGRDLAGPAIDWDANPTVNLRNADLETVLNKLFEGLQIKVIIGAGADASREVHTRQRPGGRGLDTSVKHRRKTVDLSHPRPNERVFQVAESIVKKLGYMLWIAPATDGSLAVIVDTPNYDQPAQYLFQTLVENGVVKQESNILDSHYEVQIRNIPTHVYAMGRAERGDKHPARHRTAARANVYTTPLSRFGPGAPQFLAFDSRVDPNGDPSALSAPSSGSTITTALRRNDNAKLHSSSLVIDPLPPQPRYLHSKRARDPKTGAQEAQRVLAEAMAKFRIYTCTVKGHGQKYLYAVNSMARVTDPFANVDEDMLITRVQFSGSREQGQTTQIRMGMRGAIALFPDS